MIEVLVDHSHEEDYFFISHIVVNISDENEKTRIEDIIKERGLDNMLIDGDKGLNEYMAELLGIKKELVNVEVNEIDDM